MGMGLWLLLWMGYNTDYSPLVDPRATPGGAASRHPGIFPDAGRMVLPC